MTGQPRKAGAGKRHGDHQRNQKRRDAALKDGMVEKFQAWSRQNSEQ
jgi:hypothetical protein